MCAASSTYGHAVLSGARTNYFVIGTDRAGASHGHPVPAGRLISLLPRACRCNGELPRSLLKTCGAPEWRSYASACWLRPAYRRCFKSLSRTCSNSLRARWHGIPAVDYALHHFRRVPHAMTVAWMTGQIGLSPRRFIQLFSQQVGLTPKAFCRVRRFQQALIPFTASRQVDWLRSRWTAATTTSPISSTISSRSPG